MQNKQVLLETFCRENLRVWKIGVDKVKKHIGYSFMYPESLITLK